MSYRQFSSALNRAKMFFEDLLTSLNDILLRQNVLVPSILGLSSHFTRVVAFVNSRFLEV